MKLIDINYSVTDTSDLQAVIRMYKTSFGYLPYIRQEIDVEVILHSSKYQSVQVDGVNYNGFSMKSGFFHIPFNSHRYIKSLRPDVVLVQGLVFPLQVLALRMTLGNNVKIIAQHHGGKPFTNIIKKFFLKLADKCIDGYLFTANGNAQAWFEQGVIGGIGKCYEVLEASTFLQMHDRQQAKARLHFYDDTVFLWVGRLNANKDPLTVLMGFERFCTNRQGVKLYMIYQDDDMLFEVKQLIDQSKQLKNNVVLVGRVSNDELAYWYSAADFFISGSHNEGSGYALIECMACGCIPVITNIPPFMAITNNGELAIMYNAGDVEGLAVALQNAMHVNKLQMSENIVNHFVSKLSFKAIADNIYNICKAFVAK